MKMMKVLTVSIGLVFSFVAHADFSGKINSHSILCKGEMKNQDGISSAVTVAIVPVVVQCQYAATFPRPFECEHPYTTMFKVGMESKKFFTGDIRASSEGVLLVSVSGKTHAEEPETFTLNLSGSDGSRLQNEISRAKPNDILGSVYELQGYMNLNNKDRIRVTCLAHVDTFERKNVRPPMALPAR